MARKVFLSYARQDLQPARRLYEDLQDPALEVWFDQEDLLPGMRWRPAIRKAIREARYFIALLSKRSVSERGFRHSELQQALEIMEEFPEDAIFVIPARLDDCGMPVAELEELSFADLFPDWAAGLRRLRRALRLSATRKEGDTRRTDDHAKASELQEERHRSKPHYRVGLADANSGLGPAIHAVARELNHVQSFLFFRTSALGPSRKALVTLDGSPHLDVDRLSSRFYSKVAPLGVDRVIVVTRRLLTFEEAGYSYFNHLGAISPVDERVIFTSTAGLADYAQEAGVSIEVALAYTFTSQLAFYFLDLEYHEALRGCPMDFTEDHADMVDGLRRGKFCSRCLRRLHRDSPLEAALLAMLRWQRG